MHHSTTIEFIRINQEERCLKKIIEVTSLTIA
jgi:hypothetical protein